MLVFGTYHLHGETLKAAVKNAWDAGIRAFDTAKLYRNEEELGAALRALLGPNDRVQITTKIWESGLHSIETIANALKESIAKITAGMNRPQLHVRVLLHHPCPRYMWWVLEQALRTGVVDAIGVANHDVEALTELLQVAAVRPSVNQIEVHPWLPRPELMELNGFLQKEGIPVEAHTVLGKGLYLDDPALISPLATPPQALFSFARDTTRGSVCVSSTSKQHLQELCATPDQVVPLSASKISQRFYPFKKADQLHLPDFHTVSAIVGAIRVDLQLYATERARVSELLFVLPTVKARFTDLGQRVALAMFPPEFVGDTESKLMKFHAATQGLRRCCAERHAERLKQNVAAQKGHAADGSVCCVRRPTSVDGGDEMSAQILHPKPMPVEIAPREHLQPFLDFLRRDVAWDGDREFFRGASFQDGRMDLCKQVVGPTHIAQLCDAVSHNSRVKHFLLGNNIAFDGAPELARSIAGIMRVGRPAIETWYLAGNCIDARAAELMCEALAENTTTKSLWLKRNPIGPKGMGPFRRLLEINRALTTLDLDNCGLLDEGVGVLSASQGCVLRHLYLDSNGITAAGAVALSRFLSAHRDVIKSVYVSVNRMGDEGALAITEALRGSVSLKRLSMSSNRITDAAADRIVDCVLECTSLIMLDVGCYKSTFDMGERPNYFSNAMPWIRLVAQHPTLRILDMSMNSMAPRDINVLLAVARLDGTMNVYAAPAKGQREHFSHEAFKDKRVQKFVKHPKCVVNIDSMYRNKM